VSPLPGNVLAQMGAYERHAHKPRLGARLALLLPAIGAEQIRERWRLSNDDLAVADHILRAARLLIDFNVNEAAYRYPAALADAVEVAATLAGWTEAGKSAVVQRLEGLDVPKFPLSGNDLIARGLKPGPGLGAELERLERKWIESGFTLDQSALLGELRR
jgi:poly(A) polymerase